MILRVCSADDGCGWLQIHKYLGNFIIIRQRIIINILLIELLERK